MVNSHPFHYSIRDLLGMTAILAVLIGTELPETGSAMLRYATVVVGITVIGTIRFQRKRPVIQSVKLVAIFFACSILYWWVKLWAGYLVHEPSRGGPPYWEEGMIGEGIVFPFAYFVVYLPVVIAIALLVSFLITATLNLWKNRQIQ